MTGRQRLLAAFHGATPDTVPFAPNLYHWFYFHRRNGTLPSELRSAQHPFDALRLLGAEILARWDTQWATREVYTAGEYSEESCGESPYREPVVTAFNVYPPGKNEIRRRFVTPHGVLSQTWRFSPEAGADFITEHWWTDWSQYAAVRFLLESRDYVFDQETFRRWFQRVGDDGLMMVHLTQSPLKTFHWLAGPERTSFFIADHPEAMQELARIHESKVLALLERVVDLPEAEVFLSLDNLDSVFYSPRLYRQYCHPFFAAAAERIHRRGKIFVVHACGRNRVLLPLVGRSGVDCLEGLTPPPAGDVDLSQARALSGHPNFTVNGGMDVSRLELSQNAQAQIHEYTRRLFESMGDKRHFIFASSCSTSPRTPWQNLAWFRDAARAYGKLC